MEKTHSRTRKMVMGEGLVMKDLSDKVRFALRTEMK